tara:strand:+ start:2337 stop:2540 length:204 start_codon:yes stop_codon:yes gene_type:complete
MWQALVTVCFIANMEQCVVLESQQWFETELSCKLRALEMAGDVNRYMKSHKPVRYKCRKLPNGMLTK